MTFVGVAEAAHRLQVSDRRIRYLVEAGLLRASKASHGWIIDADSLDELATRERPAHTRAFSRRIAWAAAALADGAGASWLSSSERSRLATRMNTVVDVDVWRARLNNLAASTVRVRVGRAHREALLGDAAVYVSDARAVSADAERLIEPTVAHLWVAGQEQLQQLVDRHALLTSSQGDVVLHLAEVDGLTRLGNDDRQVYRMVAATDLLSMDDARSRSVGGGLIAQAISERQWNLR